MRKLFLYISFLFAFSWGLNACASKVGDTFKVSPTLVLKDSTSLNRNAWLGGRYEINNGCISKTSSPHPPPEGRAIKFCFTRGEMLKFFPKILDGTRQFPLLKAFSFLWGRKCLALRGMFFGEYPKYLGKYQLNIPPTPFKGGEIYCKSLTFLQKIKALKFATIELNSPAPEGERNSTNTKYFTLNNKTTIINEILLSIDTIKDSTFQLLHSIPVQSTYLAIDNLQNLYIATPQGQVIQYNKNGQKKFEYNNNRLGPIGKIDVRNPLTILVYYPDLAVVVILDRNLTEIRQINLWDLDILDPKGIALANDNNIWIFDRVAAVLKKINQRGKTLFESRNLNQLTQKNLNPSFLVEQDNLIYVSDMEKGIFVFDNFGQLAQSFPIEGVEDFQVLNGHLVYYQNQQLKVFVLNSGEKTIDTVMDKSVLIKVGQKRIYTIQENQVAIYQWNK